MVQDVHCKASKVKQDTKYIVVPGVYCVVSGLFGQAPRLERLTFSTNPNIPSPRLLWDLRVGLAIWEVGSLAVFLPRKLRSAVCTSESSSAIDKFPGSMQTRRKPRLWPVLPRFGRVFFCQG